MRSQVAILGLLLSECACATPGLAQRPPTLPTADTIAVLTSILDFRFAAPSADPIDRCSLARLLGSKRSPEEALPERFRALLTPPSGDRCVTAGGHPRGRVAEFESFDVWKPTSVADGERTDTVAAIVYVHRWTGTSDYYELFIVQPVATWQDATLRWTVVRYGWKRHRGGDTAAPGSVP